MRWVLTFLACVLISPFSYAEGEYQTLAVQSDARRLSANPNNPTSAIGWRNGTIGRISAMIPILGNRDNIDDFQFRITPFVELNSPESLSFPHQGWRGRFEIEGGWHFQLSKNNPNSHLLGFFLALEHESDHLSTPYNYGNYIAVAFNSFNVRGDYSRFLCDIGVTISGITKFHFLSCNAADLNCATGRRGTQSFEGGLEAVLDWSRQFPKMTPFFGISGSWLLGHGRIQGEKRINIRSGLQLGKNTFGRWQVYGELMIGNGVGITRVYTDYFYGASIGWGL